MPPAQQFAFFTAPGSTLPDTMKQWPQGVRFQRASLSEYVLLDTQGTVFAQLLWQGLTSGGDASIWRLHVRQQPEAWCCCVDWPVLSDGVVVMQHWFGGAFPSQQMPLGAVCWPEGVQPPTWMGIHPQPAPPPMPPTPQPDATALLSEIRQLRDDVVRRSEEERAAHDERCWSIEQRMEENWYAQEESIAAYYEQSSQQAQGMVAQMQQASDSYIERVEDQCKGLEQCSKEVEKSCRKVVERATETVEQRCLAVEEKAEAAIHTSGLFLADVREELRTEVEALVSKRVDERVECAFRCIMQRISKAQLALQATALGLHDAIVDGTLDGWSESTRSRSRSRSPRRIVQGL